MGRSLKDATGNTITGPTPVTPGTTYRRPYYQKQSLFRIRDLQGPAAPGAHRPDLGQRDRGLLPHARGRIPGHADLLRRPLQLLAARKQREQERQDPPLPAQENPVRHPDPGRARRDRQGDRRHPHETARIQNTQRGMGRGDQQTTI